MPGVFGTDCGRRHAVWIEQPRLGGREIKQLENAKRATSAGSHRRFRPRRGGGRLVSVMVGVWFHELLFRSGFSHGESPLKSEGEAERVSGQALPQNAKADKREVSLCGRAQTRKEYWSAGSRGGERSERRRHLTVSSARPLAPLAHKVLACGLRGNVEPLTKPVRRIATLAFAFPEAPALPLSQLIFDRRRNALYSITKSARETSVVGRVTPRAPAVFRLTANSNFVGCSMGISPGLVPFNMVSMMRAARR